MLPTLVPAAGPAPNAPNGTTTFSISPGSDLPPGSSLRLSDLLAWATSALMLYRVLLIAEDLLARSREEVARRLAGTDPPTILLKRAMPRHIYDGHLRSVIIWGTG